MNPSEPTGNCGFSAGESATFALALAQTKTEFRGGVSCRRASGCCPRALTALATPAYAQDDTAPTTPSATEEAAVQDGDQAGEQEIVVTAQGRRQILQDVPLAVTAVGGQAMQNSGATDIRQLNQLAPSLLVSSTGTEANGSARIRGIGTVGDNPGLESSVAVFVDGVYRSRSGIGLNELGEIERIEVLRGPQGTLFGRNASAGLIHVITRRPEFEFGGYVEADLRQLRLRSAAPVRHHRPDLRAARLPARRHLFAPRRLLRRRQRLRRHRKPRQRPQPLLHPRAIAVRAQRRADGPPDRRLFDRAANPAAAPSMSAPLETFDPTPGVPGDFAVRAAGRRRLAGRQPHHRRADQPRRRLPVAGRPVQPPARADPGHDL